MPPQEKTLLPDIVRKAQESRWNNIISVTKTLPQTITTGYMKSKPKTENLTVIKTCPTTARQHDIKTCPTAAWQRDITKKKKTPIK